MKDKKVLFGRQKILLALLQTFGGCLAKVDLQKYLFLFTEIHQKNKSYEFVPFRKGCYSFQANADLCRLTEVGVITVTEDSWQLVDEVDYLDQVSKEDQNNFVQLHNQHKQLHGDELIKHVYREYPYYAINSEFTTKLMTKTELAAITKIKPAVKDYAFFTIGYEGQSFENYLNRLIKNNVKVLCDVRKNPLSRKYGFAKSILSTTLQSLKIDYIHISELGIASEKRKQFKTQTDYEVLFDDYETSTLKQNIAVLDKLAGIFKKYKRLAITCFEADYSMCHRSRVAKAMEQRANWQHNIIHI